MESVEAYKLMKQSLLHPLEFYYDIQSGGRAKVRNALLIMALAVAARLVSLMLSGYAFRTREAYDVSVPLEAAWIIIPWLTWAIASWAVATIIDGEGKFKDVLVSSAYVYIPYILLIIPLSLLSNILTLKEAAIYNGITSVVTFWTIFLLLSHVKILHDFELGKTVWITLLSFFGMLIIWFIILLIFGLISQSFQFVFDIIKEIGYRA
jgi:hypothetical protein